MCTSDALQFHQVTHGARVCICQARAAAQRKKMGNASFIILPTPGGCHWSLMLLCQLPQAQHGNMFAIHLDPIPGAVCLPCLVCWCFPTGSRPSHLSSLHHSNQQCCRCGIGRSSNFEGLKISCMAGQIAPNCGNAGCHNTVQITSTLLTFFTWATHVRLCLMFLLPAPSCICMAIGPQESACRSGTSHVWRHAAYSVWLQALYVWRSIKSAQT